MNSLLKRPWIIPIIGILVLVIGTFVGYRIYLSVYTVVIWGEFRVPKSQLILARVDFAEGKVTHAYEIHDPQLVLQIAQEISKMPRLGQITPTNFPPALNYKPITHLSIITKKYGSCGGSFWSIEPNGAVIWQDSNGYYWKVSINLMSTLEKDIHSPSTTELF